MARGGDYAYLSATAARAALVSGAFSAVDYVSALLERTEQANEHLHAFVSLSPERALRSARRADQRRAAGLRLPPLHGIPFAVKDLIDVRGTRTGAHSRFSAEAASKTAAAVLRLQRQGGICLGKLALEEFGIGSPLDDLARPCPQNPWDRRRTAGGSSSGSAVALAAGLVPLALGTDTAGSVRAPAAYCGLVALKPTNKRISMRGVLPLAHTLDTIGPMARSAADCAILFASLAGSKPGGGFKASKIGVVDTGSAGPSADADVADAMKAAVIALESLGARIGEADFPTLTCRGRSVGLFWDMKPMPFTGSVWPARPIFMATRAAAGLKPEPMSGRTLTPRRSKDGSSSGPRLITCSGNSTCLPCL